MAGYSPHRDDHLVIAVESQLAVVALQVGTAGLHQMAVGAGEVALGFWGRRSVGLPGQAPSGHLGSRKWLQIRWIDTGALGSLSGLLPLGFGRGRRCRLRFPGLLGLLSCRCIQFLGSHRFTDGVDKDELLNVAQALSRTEIRWVPWRVQPGPTVNSIDWYASKVMEPEGRLIGAI